MGHAILQAKEIVNNEPFAVVLPDRVMNVSKSNYKTENLAFMRKSFLKNRSSILLFEKVPAREVKNYGIAKLEKSLKSHGSISQVLDIVEKPLIKNAPSRFAAVGRYIFENNIFDHISSATDKNGEIEITDAIKKYIKEGNKVFATLLKGMF